MTNENRHKHESPIHYDSVIPESDGIRELQIVENDIRWNAWMNVLARCPRCEEEGALKEIEALNIEFLSLVLK